MIKITGKILDSYIRWKFFPLALFVITLLLFFFFALFYKCEECIARGGALISALCSLQVIFLLSFEERVKDGEVKGKNMISSISESDSPIEAKAKQLHNTMLNRQIGELKKMKFDLVRWNAFFAFCGEIVHGFGKLFYDFLNTYINAIFNIEFLMK